jgi:hypothetical protein
MKVPCPRPLRPAQVVTDTADWRGSADLVYGFITETLVFELNTYVIAKEVYEACNEFKERGHNAWSMETFAERFGGHNLVETHPVVKERVYATREGLNRRPGASGSCRSGSTPGSGSGSEGPGTPKTIKTVSPGRTGRTTLLTLLRRRPQN